VHINFSLESGCQSSIRNKKPAGENPAGGIEGTVQGSARIAARSFWYSSGETWSAMYFARSACNSASFCAEIGSGGASIGLKPSAAPVVPALAGDGLATGAAGFADGVAATPGGDMGAATGCELVSGAIVTGTAGCVSAGIEAEGGAGTAFVD
jgi:hypothetical protein